MMKKILFAVPRFHTNLWFAVRKLQRDGYDVKILTNIASGGEDHSLLNPTVMGKWPKYPEVYDEIYKFNPDLVIVRNSWALSRRAARVAKNLSIPCVLYNQIPANKKTSLLRRAELVWKRLPVKRITPVKGLDDRTLDPFARYLPWPVGVLNATNPIDLPKGKLKILLVGKLGMERKNQDKILSILAGCGLTDRIHLTLAGSMPKEDNEHYSKLAGFASESWVSLVGHLTFTNMGNLYAAHDICILPSHAEPLGTSPVEAMAYGVVPIISNQCGSAGYITHKRDGFIIDPNNLAELIQVLQSLLDQPEYLNQLKLAAKRTHQSELSEEAFGKRFANLISEFCDHKNA